MEPNPYKILGVTPDASQEKIKAAYRAAAAKHHPDSGGDAWAFQQVQDAFLALSGEDRPPVDMEDFARQSQIVESRFYRTEDGQSLERKETTLPALESARQSMGLFFRSAYQKQLPLQSETSYFILANILDFFLTYLLLVNGGIEANPIANWIYQRWAFGGMLVFKLASVTFICLLAQYIALRSRSHARFVLLAGTVIVAMVVGYSAWLFHSISR